MAASKRRKKSEAMPVAPNPAASRPMHVAPFGKAWAVVEGLGVIFASRDKAECEAELACLQAKRQKSPDAPPPPEEPPPGSIVEGGSGKAAGGAS
jgi:hypothetical protein